MALRTQEPVQRWLWPTTSAWCCDSRLLQLLDLDSRVVLLHPIFERPDHDLRCLAIRTSEEIPKIASADQFVLVIPDAHGSFQHHVMLFRLLCCRGRTLAAFVVGGIGFQRTCALDQRSLCQFEDDVRLLTRFD